MLLFETECATSILLCLQSVVIKIFFAVLVLCTVAVAAVVLAVHFRVQRHLQEQTAAPELRPEPNGSTPAEIAAPPEAGRPESLDGAGRSEATSFTSSS